MRHKTVRDYAAFASEMDALLEAARGCNPPDDAERHAYLTGAIAMGLWLNNLDRAAPSVRAAEFLEHTL